MKSCSFYFLIFICLFHAIDCSGKNSPPIAKLNLEKLVKEAVARNPNLAATRPRIEAAALASDRAILPDDPYFLFRAINNQIEEQLEFLQERRYKFQQKLHFPGTLRLKQEVAQQVLEFMRSQEITTHNDLVLQTKFLYFKLYFNHVAQNINKQNKKIVSRIIDSATALYKTGKKTQADITKAQVEKQLLNDELLTLESDEASLKAMINSLLDRPQSIEVGKPEEIVHENIQFNYKKLEKMAMESRPELKGQKALVKKQKKIAELTRRKVMPDIDFEIMIQTRPRSHKHAVGVNVGFSVPIWARQKQKREADEAEAMAIANSFELQNLRAMIKGNIKAILAQLDAAQEKVALYKTGIIPKIIKTLDSNESNYRVGKGEFITFLDTRRQLQNSLLEYENAKVEKEILLAKLEREVGIPIEKIIIIDKPSLRQGFGGLHAFDPRIKKHGIQAKAKRKGK